MGNLIIRPDTLYEVENKWFLGIVPSDSSIEIGELVDDIFHELALSDKSSALLATFEPSEVFDSLLGWNKASPLETKEVLDKYMGPPKGKNKLPNLLWAIKAGTNEGELRIARKKFSICADESFSEGTSLLAQATEWRDLFKEFDRQFSYSAKAPSHYKFRIRHVESQNGNPSIATIKYKMFDNGEINLERQMQMSQKDAVRFFNALGLFWTGFQKTKRTHYKKIATPIGPLKAEYVQIPIHPGISLAFLEVEMETYGRNVSQAQRLVNATSAEVLQYGARSHAISNNVREGGLRMNRGYKNIILSAQEGVRNYFIR